MWQDNRIEEAKGRRWRLLLLGAQGPLAEFDDSLKPAAETATPVARLEDPYDAVAVLAPRWPETLYRDLLPGKGVLKPVMDFSGVLGPAADFSAPEATAAALERGLEAMAPLSRRLEELPDIRKSADFEALFCLAMTWSRERSIEPAYDPRRPEAIHYPLLRGLPRARHTLEALRDAELVRRRHFDRLHICDECHSSRLNVREVCPDTGSSHLKDVSLVHHYECGFQGPETDFLDGQQLTCPKCRKDLHHYGVDYDKPSTIAVNIGTGKPVDRPKVEFICMDCGTRMDGEQVDAFDWFTYGLTEDGATALMAARLPLASLNDALAAYDQARPARDFLLILEHDLERTRRYGGDLTLARFDIRNGGSLREELGRRAAGEMFDAVVRLLIEVLRETDLITAQEDSIYIAMPETTAGQARKALDRACRSARETIEAEIDVEAVICDEDGIAEATAHLGRRK